MSYGSCLTVLVAISSSETFSREIVSSSQGQSRAVGFEVGGALWVEMVPVQLISFYA